VRVSGVAIATVIASALCGAGLGLWPALAERLPEPSPVTLGGRVPLRSAPLGTWLGWYAEQAAESEVLVRLPEGTLSVHREELGLSLDREAAFEELTKPRQRPAAFSRLRFAFGGAPPEAIDVAPAYRFDPTRAAAWLSRLAPQLERAPIDARLDLAGRKRIEASSGRELDLGASLSRMAALGAGGELALAFSAVPAKIPSSTVMAPGDVWSFNRAVGPRTLERGFIDAPVIVADEVEPGVGGGVCQVATTLFAAGVLGGLDVVQRRSHSRPSGYAPLGLDATVIDGEVDLQLRNPYSVPIIVHAFLPVPTKIRVEMLGAVPPGKVEHSYAVHKSEDFFRRVARHPELRPDQIKRQQKGSPGYEVVSTVRTHYLDGSERVRHYSSTYYPVPEIYWVGSAVDPASLPDLPERATHTELDSQASGAPTLTPTSFTP
jgi:hypothetical protein